MIISYNICKCHFLLRCQLGGIFSTGAAQLVKFIQLNLFWLEQSVHSLVVRFDYFDAVVFPVYFNRKVELQALKFFTLESDAD